MAKKREGGPRRKKASSRRTARAPRVKPRTPSSEGARRASELTIPRGSRKARRYVAAEESRSDAVTAAPDRDDFRFLVEKVGDIFYVADFDCSRFHYISRSYETIWGRSRQSLYDNAHSWFEAVHPNDRERLARIMMENLGRGGAYSSEYRVVHADGGVRWVWDRAYEAPDSRGRPCRVVGLVEDITARKQAEAALRESERRLSTLMSNLPGVAYRCRNDRDRTTEFISAGCRALTEYEPADFLERRAVTFNDLIHPDDRDAVWNSVQVAVDDRQPFQIAYRIRMRGGCERWVWEQGRGVFDESGAFLALEGYIVDITDRKREEEELARFQELESAARLAAEAAVQVRDEFLSIAAHEFRTPLAALQIQVECLLRGLKEQSLDPKRLEQSVEIANRQVRRLVRLVAGLLDITRISTGRFELETEECDLVEIVADVLARNHYSLERCGCEPELRAPAPVPGRWDRDRIEQIAENLLSNAMKFGEGKPIEIDVCAEDGVGVFRIRDHGAGIEPSLRERIFEPYERGSLGPHYGGLGMGLYIAREIVRAHGGKIRAEAQSGEGAVVTVELPTE
jgi:PAS domain S-box-containing protein